LAAYTANPLNFKAWLDFCIRAKTTISSLAQPRSILRKEHAVKRAVLAGAALLACTISGFGHAAPLVGWYTNQDPGVIVTEPGVSADKEDPSGDPTLQEPTSCELGLKSCISIDTTGIISSPQDIGPQSPYFAFSAKAGSGLLYLSALTIKAYKGGNQTDTGWALQTSAKGITYADEVGCNPFPPTSCKDPNAYQFNVDLSDEAYQGLASIDFRLYAYSPNDAGASYPVTFGDILLEGRLQSSGVSLPASLALIVSGLVAGGLVVRRRESRQTESRE
jgi:hypothetical protein